MVIEYTKTHFIQPERISEETYNALKFQLIRNPDFQIDPNPETFTQHFKGILTFLKIYGGCSLLALTIGDIINPKCDNIFCQLLTLLFGVGMFVAFFLFLILMLEGRSYATYLKEKKEYFSRMKYTLQNTNSYQEFYSSFYNK